MTEKNLAQRKALESEELAQCQYEASRRAEQRYRAFLNFLPDPVFVFNLDGSVSYLNPAFEKVFGWTLAELKGKRIPFVPNPTRPKHAKGSRVCSGKRCYTTSRPGGSPVMVACWTS